MRIQHGTIQLLLLVSTLAAADDAFVGKWKVNPSRSTLTDEMKVEAVGENRYAITFGPGAVDTVTADGTDQPGLQGTTLAVTVRDANHWRVVRKREGRLVVTGNWTLSQDGRTLDDDFTGYREERPNLRLHYVYERTAGSSGFTGTWDSVTHDLQSTIELQIQPWEQDGLSFASSALQISRSLRFDGNDYPNTGSNAPSGSVASGRRVNERAVEITDKFKGAATNTLHIELSPDLRTLTVSNLREGESKPKNIFVFDRE